MFYLSLLVFSQNCGPNKPKCAIGCCSQFNWCGIGKEWCGTGCQSQYGPCDATNATGIDNGGKCGLAALDPKNNKCKPGLCCSKYGYCGNTDAHCNASDCQSQYGQCNVAKIVGNGEKCGPLNGNKCANGLCCSKYGYCGDTDAHCNANSCQPTWSESGCVAGVGYFQKCGPNGFNAKCRIGMCCSKSLGVCGDSFDICRTDANGCDPLFGECKGELYGRCGTPFNNKSCPIVMRAEKCCSPDGYCGFDAQHCGTGCQKPFGLCGLNLLTQYVKLGEACGPTDNGNGIRKECVGDDTTNLCCGKNSICGDKADSCAKSKGCQLDYGFCDPNN
eukprot:NODE_89_length_21781_cov_0.895836.p6 type:complete len:332 gc:universal NODE_89_length_21781_cov_0.895836:4443-3448(-)